MEMTIEAQELKRKYMRTWRDNHKIELKAYYKNWKAENKDKVIEANIRYWNKRSAEN